MSSTGPQGCSALKAPPTTSPHPAALIIIPKSLLNGQVIECRNRIGRIIIPYGWDHLYGNLFPWTTTTRRRLGKDCLPKDTAAWLGIWIPGSLTHGLHLKFDHLSLLLLLLLLLCIRGGNLNDRGSKFNLLPLVTLPPPLLLL